MRPDEIRIIDREAARRCLTLIDPVAVVEAVARSHAAGRSDLPAEGYMQWENAAAAYTRSVAMLGAVGGDTATAYGLKLINASVTNPALGIERAGGFTVIFDPETARPTTLVEAGHVSALRTAAFTVSTLRTLGPAAFGAVSVIGCGTLAGAHVRLIQERFPAVREFHLFDIDPRRAASLAEGTIDGSGQARSVIHGDARSCAAASRVLITLTVSSEPYIEPDWLVPGTFVAHVSLDDLKPAVFLAAEAVYVDDVPLVRENPRRVLGAVMQRGDVMPPASTAHPSPGRGGAGPGRELTGTYGDVLLGRCDAIRPERGVVVSNPFGMAILDVALCSVIADRARASGEGVVVDLLGRSGAAGSAREIPAGAVGSAAR